MAEFDRGLMIPQNAGDSAETLNSALVDSAEEFISFHHAELTEPAVPSERLSDADCLLVEKAADDIEREILLRLPGWLVAFVPPFGAPCRLVLRCSAADPDAVGPFRDVSLPIHDWMMRAVLQGMSVIRDCDSSPSADLETSGVNRPKLRPSEPGREAIWIRDHIMSLDIAAHGERIASPADAVALKAGLLQMHDFLDASHSQSQSVEGKGRNAAGDYWHAIMHRREPDYSNAKYWFRHVGSHPIFPQLAIAAESLLERYSGVSPQTAEKLIAGGDWHPYAFVDFCQSCAKAESDDASLFARQVQWIEMLLLLEQTSRDALGT